MNDRPDPSLAARAREAFERALADQPPMPVEPPDPELMARVERAMEAMPLMTREMFLAHRIDDYSYEQIAEITGLSVRRVQRHMVKAMLQLARYANGDERTAWQRWWHRACHAGFADSLPPRPAMPGEVGASSSDS